MCDFDNDCGDSSDEDPAMCGKLHRIVNFTWIKYLDMIMIVMLLC